MIPSRERHSGIAGRHWEKIAEIFLLDHGLKLLQRNFSSRFGEIDLIMTDGDTTVFVEVRFRDRGQHGSSAESVTQVKQGRISRTAAWYLAKHPHRAAGFCRFDVVSIDGQTGENVINWTRNAFYSTIG